MELTQANVENEKGPNPWVPGLVFLMAVCLACRLAD